MLPIEILFIISEYIFFKDSFYLAIGSEISDKMRLLEYGKLERRMKQMVGIGMEEMVEKMKRTKERMKGKIEETCFLFNVNRSNSGMKKKSYRISDAFVQKLLIIYISYPFSDMEAIIKKEIISCGKESEKLITL